MTKHFLQKLNLILALHQCVSMYLGTLSILDSLGVISGENVTKLQVSPPWDWIWWDFPPEMKAKNSIEYISTLIYFHQLSINLYWPDCSCCKELLGHSRTECTVWIYTAECTTYWSKHKSSWLCKLSRWWWADIAGLINVRTIYSILKDTCKSYLAQTFIFPTCGASSSHCNPF